MAKSRPTLTQEERDMIKAGRKLDHLLKDEAFTIFLDMLKEIVRGRMLNNHAPFQSPTSPDGKYMSSNDFYMLQQFNKGAVNGLTTAISLVEHTVTAAKEIAASAEIAFDDSDEDPEGEPNVPHEQAP